MACHDLPDFEVRDKLCLLESCDKFCFPLTGYDFPHIIKAGVSMKMLSARLLILGMIAFGSAHADTLLVYDPVDCYNNDNDIVPVTTVVAGVLATDLIPNGGIFSGANCDVWPVEAITWTVESQRLRFVCDPARCPRPGVIF